MKVKELIKRLQDANPECEVIYGHPCFELTEVDCCKKYVSLRSDEEDYPD